MSAIAFSANTIEVLWRRDLLRFLRQPSRILGALGQPIVFWLILGSGFSATFAIPNSSLGYMEFFFPGVVTMVLVFASIFASVSLIDDRQQGFLQAILAGPGSRTSLVLGKCLGSASVALLQAGLFLLLAPLAGFSFFGIDWPLLILSMVLTTVGLTAMGFAVSWLVDNVQAYHALQMTLLVPLWIVSGAMFPPVHAHAVFTALLTANPLSYAVAAMRQGLYGGHAPAGTVLVDSPVINLVVVAGFAFLSLLAATLVCDRVHR